jgi:uncharacterized protein YjcR
MRHVVRGQQTGKRGVPRNLVFDHSRVWDEIDIGATNVVRKRRLLESTTDYARSRHGDYH